MRFPQKTHTAVHLITSGEHQFDIIIKGNKPEANRCSSNYDAYQPCNQPFPLVNAVTEMRKIIIEHAV